MSARKLRKCLSFRTELGKTRLDSISGMSPRSRSCQHFAVQGRCTAADDELRRLPEAPGVGPLKATKQPIDTSVATGEYFLDILGVFAEFEASLRGDRQLVRTFPCRIDNTLISLLFAASEWCGYWVRSGLMPRSSKARCWIGVGLV